MHTRKFLAYGLVCALSMGAFVTTLPVLAEPAQGKVKQQKKQVAKKKMVIQISDLMAKKWGLALNNAANAQKELGKENIDIEIVAYGPGIDMLLLESEVGGRVQTALESGIKIVACMNTMRNMGLSEKDMLPGITYVNSGVVELMLKQEEGYAYIRP